MQPYPYAPYPNKGGMPMPVGYVAAVPYQPNDHQRNTARKFRQPPAGLPPPPMTMMMPMIPNAAVGQIPTHHPLAQQFQYYQPNQGYYSNVNTSNHVNNPAATATAKQVGKKGTKENKSNTSSNALDVEQNHGIQSFVKNTDVNELLKHKGTKLKVSKIYRISKSKPSALIDDSSDDEIEQVHLSSPRLRTTAKQATATLSSSPSRRQPTTTSPHRSGYSTCSDCSECQNQTSKHVYDDCPECRAEYKREQMQNKQRKRR